MKIQETVTSIDNVWETIQSFQKAGEFYKMEYWPNQHKWVFYTMGR